MAKRGEPRPVGSKGSYFPRHGTARFQVPCEPSCSALPDIATGLPRSIWGLALDPSAQRLYFTDHANDRIGRVDVDGENLVLDLIASTNPHDLAVDSRTSTFYWTEGAGADGEFSGSIRAFDLDAGDARSVLTGLSSFLCDLVLIYLPTGEIFRDGFSARAEQRVDLVDPSDQLCPPLP